MSACSFLGDVCMLPVCSGSPIKHPLSNISLCVYLSKKKLTSVVVVQPPEPLEHIFSHQIF